MSEDVKLNKCPFSHIEKDFEHELSVVKQEDQHGLARVCCPCGYRSPVMGFDKQSVIDAHNSLESDHQAKVEALEQERDELKADAEKWRALISADRIRVLGSAGFPEQGSSNKSGYRHFGIDLWHGCDPVEGEKEHAINILGWFTEAIRKARSKGEAI